MTGFTPLARAGDVRARADAGLAALRIFAGLALCLGHGIGKLPPSARFLVGVEEMGFPHPWLFAWAAALSESLGGLLLALGLLTRISAGLILATMTVAAFIRQAGDPFAERELAMLYAAVMLMFITAGGGRFSLDAIVRPVLASSARSRLARVVGAGLLVASLMACAGARGESLDDDAPLRIGYLALGDTAGSATARGVRMGVEEAARGAELIGRRVELVVETASSREELSAAGERLARTGASAIVGGDDEATCRAMRDIAERQRILFLNVGCRSDALRERESGPHTFHVEASDSMYRIAAEPGEAPVLWHADLTRYGAAQLNDRFRARLGEGADGSAWAGWMAVKILWEAALRAESTRPEALARYLASTDARFDGHKGRRLAFDARTRQLDQPLYARAGDGEENVIEERLPMRSLLPPGGLPSGAGRLLLVSNEGSETVSIIDAQERRVIATVPVHGRPRGIHVAPDGTHAFVALSDDAPQAEGDADAIVAIDLATGRAGARFSAGTDPEQFAIAPDASRLYAANEDAGTLSITELASGRVVATLLVGIEPEGVAVSPDGRWVYVTAETSNTVSVIDSRRNEVVASFLVDVRPRAAAFSPDGSRAFVSAEIGGTVAVVDTRTHAVIGTIALPEGAAKPVGVAVSRDGSRVYVANGHANSVSELEPSTGRVVRTIPVGQRPWGLVLSPDGRWLYTANGVSNDVSIVDVARGVEVQRIAVGERPWGVAVSKD